MDDRDWQAESDFNTLQRAEEVKGDKDRHSRAIAHGKRVVTATRKVIARGQAMGVKVDDEANLANGFRKLS